MYQKICYLNMSLDKRAILGQRSVVMGYPYQKMGQHRSRICSYETPEIRDL